MADHPNVNVHELAALPYGRAQEELKKAGLWCERLGGEGELKSYRVRVRGTATIVAYVTVEARSEEAAQEAALDEADKSGDWEIIDADADAAEVVS